MFVPAHRRGEDPDAVDELEKKAKRAPRAAPPKVVKDAWQQPKRQLKTKTQYKTYEEIVAESGAAPEGVGMLVDLSGNAVSGPFALFMVLRKAGD